MALQTPRGVQAIGALVCSAGRVREARLDTGWGAEIPEGATKHGGSALCRPYAGSARDTTLGRPTVKQRTDSALDRIVFCTSFSAALSLMVGQRVSRGGELPGMGDATHGRPVERKAVLRHASQIAAGQGGRPRGQEEMNGHGAYRRSTGEHGQAMTEKGCISCLARRYAS